MTKPTAFIDADILLHRAVSFVDDEFDGEPMCDWRLSVYYFDKLLDKWLKEIGSIEDYYCVVSPSRNFRYDLFKDYKGNRTDIIPHPTFSRLKEEIKDRIDTVWEPNIEADDYIGIMCSGPENTVAVSADKDFATVPCRLIIPSSHDRKKPIRQSFSVQQADYNWLKQTMTGDTIDNYKGIPGVGPVKAEEILDDPRKWELKSPGKFLRGPRKGQDKPKELVAGSPCSQWEAMVSYAGTQGVSRDELLTQARLARILRHGEYNFETKEITLWTPSANWK